MMNNLEQANLLLNQDKYRKALVQIRKVKSKDVDIRSQCLEIEASCLYHLKQYPLSLIKLEEALTLVDSKSRKLNIMNNLVAINIQLSRHSDAIKHMKDCITIESSVESYENKSKLINIALSCDDFKTVKEYGPQLINSSAYSMFALCALIQAGIETADRELSLKYLKQADGEIRTTNSLKPSSGQIIAVLDSYYKLKELEKGLNLINFLSSKYSKEEWFSTCKATYESESARRAKTKIRDSAPPTGELSQDTKFKKLVCTNDQVEDILEALMAHLLSMGAKLHDGLAIKEDNGELSIFCNHATKANEVFIDVPLSCMPLLNDYKCSINKKRELVSKIKKNAINSDAQPVMALLTRLFNVTGKLDRWKEEYPLFALANRDKLVKKLLSGKSSSGAYYTYYSNFLSSKSDDALIECFFGSRAFIFSKSDFKKTNKKFKREYELALLPIIEFTNHKMGAPGFYVNQDTTSMQTFITPGEKGRQVYAQYNLDDPLITFLNYGFVDTFSPWIYSVPLFIKTSLPFDIEVRSFTSVADINTLPEDMHSIAEFFPGSISKQDEILTINSIIIPGKGKIYALKEVLTHTLKEQGIDEHVFGKQKLMKELQSMERQIITKNLEHWNELLDMAEEDREKVNRVVLSQLTELCQFNINHIQYYMGQTGSLLANA